MSIREKKEVSSCLCDTHRKYNRFIYSCWIAVFDALYEMQSLEKWCPFFSSLYNVTIPLGGKGLWKNRFYRLYLHEPSEMHFTWNHSKIISTSSVYIYKRVLCICSNIFSRNCHFNTDAKLFFYMVDIMIQFEQVLQKTRRWREKMSNHFLWIASS